MRVDWREVRRSSSHFFFSAVSTENIHLPWSVIASSSVAREEAD
jgi:hypothetical protein